MMKSLTFNDCYKEKLFSIPLFSELPDYLKSEILKTRIRLFWNKEIYAVTYMYCLKGPWK